MIESRRYQHPFESRRYQHPFDSSTSHVAPTMPDFYEIFLMFQAWDAFIVCATWWRKFDTLVTNVQHAVKSGDVATVLALLEGKADVS